MPAGRPLAVSRDRRRTLEMRTQGAGDHWRQGGAIRWWAKDATAATGEPYAVTTPEPPEITGGRSWYNSFFSLVRVPIFFYFFFHKRSLVHVPISFL